MSSALTLESVLSYAAQANAADPLTFAFPALTIVVTALVGIGAAWRDLGWKRRRELRDELLAISVSPDIDDPDMKNRAKSAAEVLTLELGDIALREAGRRARAFDRSFKRPVRRWTWAVGLGGSLIVLFAVGTFVADDIDPLSKGAFLVWLTMIATALVGGLREAMKNRQIITKNIDSYAATNIEKVSGYRSIFVGNPQAALAEQTANENEARIRNDFDAFRDQAEGRTAPDEPMNDELHGRPPVA